MNAFTIADNRFKRLFKVLSITVFISMCISIIAAKYFHQWWIVAIPLVIPIVILPFINIKWFYYCFIVLLALSSDIQISSLSLNIPAEPIMMAMMLLCVILIIWNKDYLTKIPSNVVLTVIGLQLLWLIVSVIFATYHGIALKFLLSKMWFLASFLLLPLLIFRDKKDIITVAKLLLIPVFIHTFFVIVWHALLGFGYNESNQVVFPFYKNHVDYGSMLSILFAVNFTLMVYHWRRVWLRYLLMFVLLYLSVALVAASSRGAMLAAMFCVIVFFAIKKKIGHWVMPSFYVFILAIILFFSYKNNYINYRPDISKNASQETLMETIVGTFTGKDMSSMERFYRWIASIRMTQEHPVVGVGPNNWYYHYKPYAVQSFRTWVSRNPEQSTTHNYFLLMLTEQGIPGMLLYALLMYYIFSRGQRLYYRLTEREDKHLALALLLIIATVFVNNFFSEFLETHKIGGVFYLSIASLVLLDKWSRNKKGNMENDASHITSLNS